MKHLSLLFILFFLHLCIYSQRLDSVQQGRTDTLAEVIVEAFNSRVHWKLVPAAVAVISSREMERYAGASMVPVLNSLPGVRMEERSPSSYRLSFRGSLLRSPFGVRNVKVYWNDIPLTDGGGNTYLNLVDIGQLTGAEVIKGPAASIYGAGTGGALLLRSELPLSAMPQHRFNAGISGGSFGYYRQEAGWQYQATQFSSSLQQVHQQADGYRDQSASRKYAIKWQGNWQYKQQQFRFLFFYTDLYYQTPGGITLAQMQLNPKLSRQAAGAFPGSIQQRAAIYNQTVFGGIHHTAAIASHWSLRSFITANSTAFTNPFITNYEDRDEKNTGVGSQLVFSNDQLQWTTGAEWLYNHSGIFDYGNRSGLKDTVQFKDNVFANQWFLFTQLQYAIGTQWSITTGVSVNSQSYRFKRLTDPLSAYADRSIKAVVTPRMALLYRLSNNVSLYALAAKGFSPPALAEVRPSDGNFYGDLAAESGWNYEAGIKGHLVDHRLQFDIAVYSFKLDNAIVRRNNTAGAEYFVNAGSTSQGGMEWLLKYQLVRQGKTFFSGVQLWSSYTYQPYRFENYQQGNTRFSGNALTGVPRNIWVIGADIEAGKWYANTSLNSSSSLPLNDANDAYADAYRLVQLKLGYKAGNRAHQWHFFAGIDNLLDENYSLGNDINAAGRRYYNPAPGRSIFAGFQVKF